MELLELELLKMKKRFDVLQLDGLYEGRGDELMEGLTDWLMNELMDELLMALLTELLKSGLLSW